MMVPGRLEALEGSPLFSPQAIEAYLREPGRAAELKANAPASDESVASFVRRHFGEEVTRTVAAPLLSGVFGGDIELLSVRAVMPAFVTMEAEHGSLIAALERRLLAGKDFRADFFEFQRRHGNADRDHRGGAAAWGIASCRAGQKPSAGRLRLADCHGARRAARRIADVGNTGSSHPRPAPINEPTRGQAHERAAAPPIRRLWLHWASTAHRRRMEIPHGFGFLCRLRRRSQATPAC